MTQTGRTYEPYSKPVTDRQAMPVIDDDDDEWDWIEEQTQTSTRCIECGYFTGSDLRCPSCGKKQGG